MKKKEEEKLYYDLAELIDERVYQNDISVEKIKLVQLKLCTE